MGFAFKHKKLAVDIAALLCLGKTSTTSDKIDGSTTLDKIDGL